MEIFFDDIPLQRRQTSVVTWGNFDGMHKGHQALLAKIKAQALPNMVVLFDPHPKHFFKVSTHQTLMPLFDKLEYLASLNIDRVLVLSFNQELSRMSAHAFLNSIVKQMMQAKMIILGEQASFGADRSGHLGMAYEMGFQVAEVKWLYSKSKERISSSAIRSYLQAGDIQQVTEMLGRTWSFRLTIYPQDHTNGYIFQHQLLSAIQDGCYHVVADDGGNQKSGLLEVSSNGQSKQGSLFLEDFEGLKNVFIRLIDRG